MTSAVALPLSLYDAAAAAAVAAPNPAPTTLPLLLLALRSLLMLAGKMTFYKHIMVLAGALLLGSAIILDIINWRFPMATLTCPSALNIFLACENSFNSRALPPKWTKISSVSPSCGV